MKVAKIPTYRFLYIDFKLVLKKRETTEEARLSYDCKIYFRCKSLCKKISLSFVRKWRSALLDFGRCHGGELIRFDERLRAIREHVLIGVLSFQVTASQIITSDTAASTPATRAVRSTRGNRLWHDTSARSAERSRSSRARYVTRSYDAAVSSDNTWSTYITGWTTST